MRTARVFLAEADVIWRERLPKQSVLPLVAEASGRREVVKALRLAELAPENRRPLFLYEAPFAEAEPYFHELTEAIGRDYEAVRKGVANEGVELPAFAMSPLALGPLERATLAMEEGGRAARRALRAGRPSAARPRADRERAGVARPACAPPSISMARSPARCGSRCMRRRAGPLRRGAGPRRTGRASTSTRRS